MSPRARRWVWGLIAAGTAIRLGLAFLTFGVDYDIESLRLVSVALRDDPLHVYGTVNSVTDARWPYPPGMFPLVAAAGWFADWTGLPFHGVIQLPSIAADAAIAWVVQAALGRRGAPERDRVVAAGLVALGPTFAVVSGYHGQIDAVAALPALLALYVWLGRDSARPVAAPAGLIGLGAAVKTVPLITALAFLPWARGWRERAVILLVPAATVALVLLPFLLADFRDTQAALRSHTGLPGIAGLSLLAQPEVARAWLGEDVPDIRLTSFTHMLWDLAPLIAAGAVLLTAAWLVRHRVDPVRAAVLLWLAFYAFSVNLSFPNLVWGLPFLLAAGRLRTVAGLQALLLVPTLLIYGSMGRHFSAVEYVYVPFMLAVSAAFVVLFVREARDVRREAGGAELATGRGGRGPRTSPSGG